MTETKTDKPKKRKYKRRKTRMSFGPRGLETLKLCYQLGGLTVEQHSTLLGTTKKHSYKLLASLADQRLLEQAPVQTAGRPRDFHFLSKANGSRGVVLGGHEAGLHERRSKEQYKFHGLPAHVEHAHARNGLYLCLRDAASKSPGVEVPRDEMHGESYREFPLSGAKKSERIYPDGLFEVRFDPELSCRYYLEYESRARRGEALGKLDCYGAHLHRLLKEEPGSVEEWLRPVIFLYPRNETTVHVNRVLLGALTAEAPELSRFRAWRRAALGRGVHARRLVLLGSMEDIGRRGALDTRFGVLETYPDGAPVADFRAVAREVSDSVERARGEGR